MNLHYLSNLPSYVMEGFEPVRNCFDNLSNILKVVEIVNICPDCITIEHVNNFDFVIFTGPCSRVLIRKKDGYFTMAMPFQVINNGGVISFNYDPLGLEVNGLFVSAMRNAIAVSKNSCIANDEIVMSICETFGLSVSESIIYTDTFFTLLSDDHGYFRFDDDPKRENGDVHPRFHFDFFYKNSSSVKVGTENFVDIEWFHSLFDKSVPKFYLKR